MGVELFARGAGLNNAIEVFGMDCQDPVHVLQVDADAAEGSIDVPFEGCPGSEWDKRNAARTDPDGSLNVLGRLRKDDGIGRFTSDPGHGVSVLLTDGQRTHEAMAKGRGEFDQSLIERVRRRSSLSRFEHFGT